MLCHTRATQSIPNKEVEGNLVGRQAGAGVEGVVERWRPEAGWDRYAVFIKGRLGTL